MQVDHSLIQRATSASQTSSGIIKYKDISSQAGTGLVPYKDSSSQCDTCSVDKISQVDGELLQLVESSVQMEISTTDRSLQVDNDSIVQIDASCQVTPDPVVAVQDIPSNVTLDLGSHNSTQTPFVWPGYENDLAFDTFWPNPPICVNADCRYAGINARRCRGTLFRCSVCNITMCRKCTDETGHDYMCEARMVFHNINN